MPQADVIVAVGAHIDLFSTKFRYGIISREATLIHHSTVATDIGVVFPVAQAVAGSTLSFVEGLAAPRQGKVGLGRRRQGAPRLGRGARKAC